MPSRSTQFQTIRSEGGLLPPDLLRRIVDPAGKVSGIEPASYGLPAGERINEAITQTWNRLRRHWAEFRAAAKGLPESDAVTGLTNDKWSLPLLRELGFGFLATTAGPIIDGKIYAISRFAGATPIHLVGCGVSLDHRTAGVRGAAAGNPHGLLQEFLNRSPGHLWAILSNGLSFRILRDNQALSRQSYLEFDLEAMFDGEVYSDFVLLWLLAHASRFLPRTDGRVDTCWLEAWSKEAAEQGVAALTDLRGGVEKALEILGQGFVSHPRNTALRDALRRGEVKLSDFHHQLLRVVYRLIFLFVAEDRELEGASILHPQDKSEASRLARECYSNHYSTARLRDLASRIKGSRHGDLWRQFQLVVGALSGDAKFAAMREKLVLPALGSMLWNPASTALLNGPGLSTPGTELSNVDFLEALRHLAFIRKDKILRPVDYKNLGSEEFGGVYESFLALTPQISSDGARFTFAEFAGNERKTSGTYYTPDSLVQCLLDSALDPVVEARLADAERIAKFDWAAVEKEIQSDPAKRTYLLAFLTKHAGASKTASSEDRKRAWDSIAPTARRWKLCEEGILAIKACDMACGSGHFLVGAAHRLARHLARVRALAAGESEPSPLLYQTALRDVIGHCLYGVDINPMAVELCKVTLWLEALEPGKPLSFLDHHIRCGNSLLGATPEVIAAGLPDEAFDPIEGDDKSACSSLKKLNRAQREGLRHLFIAEDNAIRDRLYQTAAAIDEIGDNRPEDIQRKEAAFRAEQSNYDFQKAWDLANLWCAGFVIKKRLPDSGPEISNVRSEVVASLNTQPLATQGGLFGGTEELPKAKGKKAKAPPRADSENAIGITTQHLRDFVESGALPEGLLFDARRLADQYQFFHWHLAFPEVFVQGGFDVNLGNPPWEQVQVDPQEVFAAIAPDVANIGRRDKREAAIQALRLSNPELVAYYDHAKRSVGAIQNFFHGSGRFPLAAKGRINSAPLFLELSSTMMSRTGYAGLIVPTGIATDTFTQHLFRDLVVTGRLRQLFDFENEDFLFQEVHHAMRFCLLTLGSERGANATVNLMFFARQVADLGNSERRFDLTSEDFCILNPNTNTCPVFRFGCDALLLKHIAKRVPVLTRESSDHSPWGFSGFLMFMMDAGSSIFHDSQSLAAQGYSFDDGTWVREAEKALPLLEGKMVHLYDHRFGTYAGQSESQLRQGKLPELSPEEHLNPGNFTLPRYWVPNTIVAERIGTRWGRRWHLAWRDITNAKNERTLIASIIPQCAAGDTLPLAFISAENQPKICALLANLCSFALDYVARQKVSGMHLRFNQFQQLCVLPPSVYGDETASWAGKGLQNWIDPRVLELAYTAWDLEPFARDRGWSGPPFRWDEERRFLLRCELDAAFFHLYLGTEAEWRQQPAALTQSFPTPRDAVAYIMDTFPIVKRKDEEKFNGDYRTKRTILEIYDALAEAIKTGKPYQTRLEPPPADPRCCHPPQTLSAK